MADRVIGLDIGTNAVRVAEVALGPRPVLRAFGQIALPPGAMRDGEVVAADLVSAAIKRLWHETGLKNMVVRIGVASQRVVVRTIDMPAMSEVDLESALRFQVQEYIAIPVDDAIVDFQIIEEFVGPDDEPLVRVLVAAAHRDIVLSALAAAEGAGLRVAAVDLIPFALIRSLVPPPGDEPRTEAIVSIGAGVTVVVVHEDGLPRFVRIVAIGGNMLTEAISQELGVPTETAEALKRHTLGTAEDPDTNDLVERADRVVQSRMLGIIGEVRGSLDFFAAQAGAAAVTRVLLTGGGSLTSGLAESLEPLLAVPVELAQPHEMFEIGDIGFPPDEIPTLDPYLAVPAGVALGGAKTTGRRISLMPGGRRDVYAQRRVLAGAGTAIAIVAFLLILVSLARAKQVSDARQDVARQTRVNAGLQRRIAQFQGSQQVEQQVAAARAQVTNVLAGDVAWSRVLDDIARTIPNDVWLSGFQAQAAVASSAPATGTTGTTAPAAPAGGGGGSASFTNLWVPQLAKNSLGARSVVNFTSTADLGTAARSNRLQRVLQGTP